jgi:hypothetical protein
MALIPTTQVNVSPDDYKRRIAYALMQEGAKNEPIQAWTQGLAKLAQGALGGYQLYQADEKQKQDEADATQAYLKFLTPGGTPQGATPTTPPDTPPAQATGPVAKALGKPIQLAAADPAAVTGPRPGGPVAPSGKVWGDAEAEAAGLYEKPKSPVATALANPNAPIQPTPVQTTQVSPAPTDAQMSDAKARIAALLQSPNRAERQLGKSLAEAEIVRGMKPPETTDELKEYNFAKSQGYKGSFVDFKTELKKAGATNVNVDTKGENAFSVEAGKSQAKRYDEIASEGQTAKQMISDVQTLKALGDNIQTGKLAEAKAAIGPYAQALGIDVKGLSEIQAFEAIVKRVAPSLRVKGSGAQSDFELKNFLKSLPNLGNTPEGNAIATKTLEGLYDNKVRAAEIASAALSRRITPEQADKLIRELPDHMAEYRDFLKKSPPGGAPKLDGLKKKYGLD